MHPVLSLLLSVLPSLAPAATGSEGPPPVLQPTTYASASGEYELFVNPTERLGGGAGHYQLSRRGEVLWKKRLPVTMWQAQVTNSGYSFGFAYSKGWRDYRSEGSLHILLLDPAGEVLLDEVTRRKPSRAMHSPPAPLAGDIVTLEEQDLVRVRLLRGERPEPLVWQSYRLSSGERLADWSPPAPLEISDREFMWLQALVAIPGTDLTLMHWWYVRFAKRQGVYPTGGVFSLVDMAGHEVWNLRRLTDYTLANDEDGMRRLERRIKKDGAILQQGADSSFELWLPSDQTRAAFSLGRSEDQWVVLAGAESEFHPAQPSLPGAPTLELKQLGTLPLGNPKPARESSIRDIQAFGFSGEGSLEFIRGPRPDFDLVQLEAGGAVAHEVHIQEFLREGGSPSWYDGNGNLWYVAVHYWGEDPHTELFRIDGQSGAIQPLDSFPCPSIERLISRTGGGFVLLGKFGSGNGSVDVVLAVDAAGREIWRMTEDYRRVDDPGLLFAPTDLAVMHDGTLVVLDVVRDTLQLFTAAGEYLRTVELEEAWGREPRYPARLFPDGQGNVWVVDADRLCLTSLVGELLATCRPDFPARTPFPVWSSCCAPDGTLWTTDRSMLFSVASKGRPGPHLGEAPTAAFVEEADSAWIDRRGHIFVLDERSKAWHEFNAQGEPLQVYAIPEGVTHEDGVRPRPAIGLQGDVYVPLENGNHFQFRENGEAVGQTKLGADRVQFGTRAQERWSSASYSTSLVQLGGSREDRPLLRRPDGLWWAAVDDFHLSADGSRLAVLEGGESFLSLFDGDGTGQAVLPLPPGRYNKVSITGRFVALADFGDEVLLVDLERGSMHKLQVPESKNYLRWGFSPAGDELWAIEADPLRLLRFALPGK